MDNTSASSNCLASVRPETFLLEYLHKVRLRVPHMKEQRQVVFLRQAELGSCTTPRMMSKLTALEELKKNGLKCLFCVSASA